MIFCSVFLVLCCSIYYFLFYLLSYYICVFLDRAHASLLPHITFSTQECHLASPQQLNCVLIFWCPWAQILGSGVKSSSASSCVAGTAEVQSEPRGIRKNKLPKQSQPLRHARHLGCKELNFVLHWQWCWDMVSQNSIWVAQESFHTPTVPKPCFKEQRAAIHVKLF